LTKKKVYLDTNILIYALVGEPSIKSAVLETLGITSKLGMKVLCTSSTEREFLNVVNHSRSTISGVTIPDERAKKIAAVLRGGFFTDYAQKRAANPSLTVEGYFAKFEFLESILSSLGIELEDVDLGVFQNDDYYVPLLDRVHEYRPFKSDSVAEHDTLHILFIQSLRKQEPSGVMGQRYWFLTNDFSLPKAELSATEIGWIQSSVNPDEWVQMLSPVLAPDTTTESLARLFATLLASRLPSASAVLQEDQILKIQGPWMDEEGLGAQEIAAIVGNEYVRSYLSRTPPAEITAQGLEPVLAPAIEEIREMKVVEAKRFQDQRKASRIRIVLLLVFLVTFDLVAAFVSIMLLSIPIGFAPITLVLGFQFGLLQLFREEIRDMLGLVARPAQREAK